MNTMCSLATCLMVLGMFLVQLPAIIAAAKSGWTMVSGLVSGLAAKVKGLFVKS